MFTREEIMRITIKGFVADLQGIRRAEQEKALEGAWYVVSRIAFDLLVKEIEKYPFRKDYHVVVTTDKAVTDEEKVKIKALNEHLYYNGSDEVTEMVTKLVSTDKWIERINISDSGSNGVSIQILLS